MLHAHTNCVQFIKYIQTNILNRIHQLTLIKKDGFAVLNETTLLMAVN